MEAVISTKSVLLRDSPILNVYRDEEGWQFLGTEEANLSDLMVVGLNQVLKHDASISAIINTLEPGFSAHRKNTGEQWEIREYSE